MGQDLSGKVALVTGASSGIGRAMAVSLAKEKAKLALVGRYEERPHAVADGLVPGGSLVVPADLAHPREVERVVSENSSEARNDLGGE